MVGHYPPYDYDCFEIQADMKSENLNAWSLNLQNPYFRTAHKLNKIFPFIAIIYNTNCLKTSIRYLGVLQFFENFAITGLIGFCVKYNYTQRS